MKNKTYIVSVFVPVTVNALVYAEVEAENKGQAIADVKKNFSKFNLEDAILDDAKVLLEEREMEKGKVTFTVDRANQYHSAAECKMCKASGEK